MARSLWLSFLLGAGFLIGTTPLRAQTVRLPKTGEPAFSVDVPTGWTYSYDDLGNLQFLPSDRNTALQLSMIVDSRITTMSLNEIAANIIKSADALPYSRSEPDAIAGHAGMAFYTTIFIKSTNLTLNMKVILVKLDNSHAACLSTLAAPNVTPEQLAALNALIGLVQLSNPK